jgi:hypothetical protein
MAVTQEASGTNSPTVSGTTYTLATITTEGIRELALDLNALLIDEFIEVTVEEKVLTGGTVRVYLIETFRGGRSDPIVKTTPVASVYGNTFKIKTTTAANRDIDWAVRKLPS